jgi:hypothetical protein
MTILTPSIHATNYSPDDNRFDQRPFLYPFFQGSYQFQHIMQLAKDMEKRGDVQELIHKGTIEWSRKAAEIGRTEAMANTKLRKNRTAARNASGVVGGRVTRKFKRVN